jgi:hypothetical protein
MTGRFEAFGCITVLIIMGALGGSFMWGAGNMPELSLGMLSGLSPDTPDWTLDTGSSTANTPVPTPSPTYGGVDIGFHESVTAMSPPQTPEYWYNMGKDASGKFEGSGVGAVWVIGYAYADGQCYLNFPSSAKSALITFSKTDENERYLDYFDSKGISVILQVEPGQADVTRIIQLVLNRYSHHPCVTGLGIDVEWLQFKDYPGGRPVTDGEAARWYSLVKSFNADYKLALTHYVTDKMPPTYRTGLYFLYDGQGFSSLDDMIEKYASWGKSFHDNPVGFYLGFPVDKVWWSQYSDPFYTLAHRTLASVDNTKGLYWVSNSVKDIYPV